MRRHLGLIIVAVLLAGCGSSGSSDSVTVAQPPWFDGVQPDAAATKLGGPDTPCPLPVAFEIPDKWSPEAITSGDFRQGGLEAKCEIDGKPASVIGYVRVFVGTEPLDHRKALEAFVTDRPEYSDAHYRDTPVGSGQGLEATWRVPDTGPRRAFVTTTPTHAVLITFGGIDEEEHRNGLKAYLLARQTLTPREG